MKRTKCQSKTVNSLRVQQHCNSGILTRRKSGKMNILYLIFRNTIDYSLISQCIISFEQIYQQNLIFIGLLLVHF